MPSQSKIKDFCQLSHRESQGALPRQCDKHQFESRGERAGRKKIAEEKNLFYNKSMEFSENKEDCHDENRAA